MFTLLAMTVLVALLGAGALRLYRRLPQWARDDAAQAVLAARIRLGLYGLSHVMERMAEEMRGSVLPSVSTSYVPDRMRFGLHPRDAARWGGYFDRLGDELRDLMLRTVAARHDLVLGSAGLQVTLFVDEDAEPGRPTFAASIASARDVAAGRPTVVAGSRTVVAETVPAAPPLRLRCADGRAVAVTVEQAVVCGRGAGADLRVDDESVSRRHARVSSAASALTVTDLGSTNGTWVNDRRIDVAQLVAGDTLRLGSGPSLTVAVDDEHTAKRAVPGIPPSRVSGASDQRREHR